MIEVKRSKKEDLAPVGSIMYRIDVVPCYGLYDVYESDNEFAEIWVPLEEDEKEVNNG